MGAVQLLLRLCSCWSCTQLTAHQRRLAGFIPYQLEQSGVFAVSAAAAHTAAVAQSARQLLCSGKASILQVPDFRLCLYRAHHGLTRDENAWLSRKIWPLTVDAKDGPAPDCYRLRGSKDETAHRWVTDPSQSIVLQVRHFLRLSGV